MKLTKKEPSALVIPFGKQKGSTIAELLVRDPSYAEWVVNQGWVAERFAELHAAILSRGAQSDDSPAHNAIQVRFLDETFRLACLLAVIPNRLADERRKLRSHEEKDLLKEISNLEELTEWDRKRHEDRRNMSVPSMIASRKARLEEIEAIGHHIVTRVSFEQRGVDVVLTYLFGASPYAYDGRFNIEIKPSIGDDFPAVMRQMGQTASNVLVVGEYGGSIPEPQVRQMFEANRCTMILVRDIEAEIANARADIASHPAPDQTP